MDTLPSRLTSMDVDAIKDAILVSVRSGAHGHMSPDVLAESMTRAFRQLHSEHGAIARGVVAVSVKPCGGVEITADMLVVNGSISSAEQTSAAFPLPNGEQVEAQPASNRSDK